MTTTSGGNMSVIDSLGNIWITPSGTDKGSLKPGEVVCVSPDGNYEGPLKPSMEYPLHRAVYNARPDIRALIHAHPPVLTSFSIVHRIPDTSILERWREICGTVGYAGYATPGSDAMAENVASEFNRGHGVVIMENHAVVAGGKDLAEALARLEALEKCATTIHSAASSERSGYLKMVKKIMLKPRLVIS
jgi:L-fuculose-phosphate aldolase